MVIRLTYRMRNAAGVCLAIFLFTTGFGYVPVQARDTVVEQADALQVSGSALGRKLPDYSFRDTGQRLVRLSDFRGKPLVISLVYTSCQSSCPVTTQTLAQAVDVARDALGRESFAVVTVGFDARADTPQRMRAFAHGQGIDLNNWRFLSTDSETRDRLVADLGFTFFPSPQGFDHIAQTSIIDAEGIVYRQVYGADFTSPHLVEPLKNLVFGRNGNLTSIDGLINRIRLFCTLYDPASERYMFDYSVVIGGSIGFTILSILAVFLLRAWLRQSAQYRAP
mgnify:CR=1 FL=1